MATTPIVVIGPALQTGLTLELYPEASGGTIANGVSGDTLTEDAAKPGHYLASVTEAITGNHFAAVKTSGGATLLNGWVLGLTDTTDQQYVTDASPTSTELVATATSDALAAAHGAGSWEGGVGAAGGGPAPLTVTVQTSLGDPIVGAIVYLLDSVGSPLDLWLPTDANGQAVFGLAAGDYQVAVGSLAGYSVPAPAAKTIVASTAATATVVLTRQAADPPSSAALCVIDDYVFDSGQNPVEGAVVSATASNSAVLIDSGILTEVRTKATTDADGHFTLSLVRADAMTAGTFYSVEIKYGGKVLRTITGPIPNTATALLKEIEAGA